MTWVFFFFFFGALTHYQVSILPPPPYPDTPSTFYTFQKRGKAISSFQTELGAFFGFHPALSVAIFFYIFFFILEGGGGFLVPKSCRLWFSVSDQSCELSWRWSVHQPTLALLVFLANAERPALFSSKGMKELHLDRYHTADTIISVCPQARS